MEKHLRAGIEKLSKSLDLEFSYTSANYNFELGLPLENSLKTFFRRYFPKRYSFGSGYLVDKDEKVSSQCDWIIYDNQYYAPLITKSNDLDNIEFFSFDSVFSVIEIKRTLNKKTLNKAIKQIRKTKKLKRSKSSPGFITPLLNISSKLTVDPSVILTNNLISGIYGFNSKLTLEEIINVLKTYDTFEEMPDFIAVHGKFYLCKSEYYSTPTIEEAYRLSFIPQQFNSYSCIMTEELTSGIFYVRLLNQLNNTFLSANDYKEVLTKIAGTQPIINSFLFEDKSKNEYEKD